MITQPVRSLVERVRYSRMLCPEGETIRVDLTFRVRLAIQILLSRKKLEKEDVINLYYSI